MEHMNTIMTISGSLLRLGLIEPVIKVRSNSSTNKANGCMPRKLVVVIEQLADRCQALEEETRLWRALDKRPSLHSLLYKANVWW
jgi:hypothetical protein